MQRIWRDASYVGQGFVVSLTLLGTVLLVAAAIALVLLTLVPGSLGVALRDLLPPGTLMAYLAAGGIGMGLLLWGLSSIQYLPRPLSVRLRWVLGVLLGMALVTATLLHDPSTATG